MKLLKKVSLLVLPFLTASLGYAQNKHFAQQQIDTLCSPYFAGRGYIDSGDLKAANYIQAQFEKIGLEPPFGYNYQQNFPLNVNTITKAAFAFGGNTLNPGIDFIVNPASPTLSGTFKPLLLSNKILKSPRLEKKLKRAKRKNIIPVFPPLNTLSEISKSNIEQLKKRQKISIFIQLAEDLTYSVARDQASYTEIKLKPSSFDAQVSTIKVNIHAHLIKNYQSQNVLGMVKGTTHQDSVIIICGHYDHLGKMGSAIYHGANDNASGIAMMLDMAEYFVKNPQKNTLVFIAFGGEEAGLIGSYSYVQNPLIPLKNTKFVLNLDLMGSGEEGATVVNATEFPKQFELLTQINAEKKYLPILKSRGKAANSDHYFFTEKGVPAFFVYTMGAYKHYHIPQDNESNLSLTDAYNQTFSLLRDFITQINE